MFKDLDMLLFWILSIEHIYLLFYVICLIGILLSGKSSEGIVSWIFTITVFPIVGIIIYLLFGINWRKKRIDAIKKGKNSPSREFLKYDTSEFFIAEKIKSYGEISQEIPDKFNYKSKKIANMLIDSENSYVTKNKSYKMFYEGKEAFTSIISDLRNAKKSIFMEYFIWKSDELGEQIKNILIEKAKEGLEIKLIFDGLGSIGKISRNYRKELTKYGIEFKYFLDIKFFLSKFNYRNHRKMTIIDYSIVHTGGMNLGEEYITGGKKFKSWRDTNVRMEGEIVNQYLTVFFTDWLNSGGNAEFLYEKIEEIAIQNKVKDNENKYFMQISSSGADTIYTTLKFLHSNMISTANKEILIQSPYFVPDSALINVLKVAALSNVDIKIMMTGVPDKKIPYWIAESYFNELILSGVQIYRYKKGFLHCKNIIIDEEISSMGTCNFDMRSFEINYEVNTVFYNKEISKDLKKQFNEDLKYCEKINFDYFEHQSMRKKLRNSFFKIFSPIM